MSRSPLRPAALVAGLAALALGLTACGSGQVDAPTSADTPQVKIVASTDAWGAVARAVGGNYARVESVISSPDVDPHGYEPTPQNAATVGEAQLLVMNGGGYDAFMTDLVAASGPRGLATHGHRTRSDYPLRTSELSNGVQTSRWCAYPRRKCVSASLSLRRHAPVVLIG